MALNYERTGAIARLTIDRADKRNAFTHAMWATLVEHLDRITAEAEQGLRVLLLHAAATGPFSAGADIGEFARHAADPAWRAQNQQAIASAQTKLARLPLPVIAAIDGDCVGGGCGLALACDLRVASPRARFGITPAKLGLAYSLHDTKLLVDLVGPAQAKRILFTAELLSADEALRIGLVEVMAGDPLTEAETLAAKMASVSGHSIRHSKAMIRRILDGQADDDADTRRLFGDAFDGPDFHEGVAAFLDKRPPRFG